MTTSTFFGLEIARRALESQQAALDVTGHNISNANSPGYTRQVPNLKATTPYTIPTTGRDLSLGSGVSMDTVTRARNAFVDRQLRGETSAQQYWTSRQTSLSNIEGVMNEPSDNSLSGALNKFWTAWSDLSSNPENSGSRAVVQERAVSLADTFHSVAQQLCTMQSDVDSDVNTKITQINTYATQIASLDNEIRAAQITGDNPNDLLDKRDNLIDELSKIVNVKVTETSDTNFPNRQVSHFQLDIGNTATSQTLVKDGAASQLVGTTSATGLTPPGSTVQNTITTVQWATGSANGLGGTNLTLDPQSGSLQADIDIRDKDLPTLLGKYDSLAQGIVTAVNDIYSPSGAAHFFDATSLSSSTIKLDTTVDTSNSTNINNIITGTTGSGDGSIAAAIAALSSGWSSLSGANLTAMKTAYGASLGDTYEATVSQFGANVQQANSTKSNEDLLVTNLTNQKDSVSGVSLDEEMTNMIQYQKSYSAAARVVTMMDDMLNTIVTGLGITR
jgi:flagellar hook-associated protein 1